MFAAALSVEDRRSLNGSFESAGREGLPAGWSVAAGAAAQDQAVAREGKASLRVGSAAFAETRVESLPIQLAMGKRYEVRVWVRTEQLEVRDTDRTPVAVGATLSMASLPFDYHSESAGGTREWKQLRLRFVATRAEDRILVLAGLGGEARGKAWFDAVSIDEVSSEGEWPAAPAVETFGPAYRYPQGGWVYLHIEGKPYERGYQHGFLLAKEIPQYLNRCALKLDPKAKERAWDRARTTANALFLRGFDGEILEEMKGIAEGASARGAKWDGRAVDLVDVATMNTLTEVELLRPALRMTPTGLEGLKLERPDYFDPARDVPVTERCSAFAATGPATRDGKMIVAHITMWPLTLSEQTNIMLDIKPAAGRRVLMQSYPGGMQSGTDYYQNDAGIVLAETTIRQSPFHAVGTPVAYRARRAVQYGTSVEEVVEHLGNRNNGLYTNEWLIGDAKTNHIAMYELGTYKTKLYRSSKQEWFGGTEGFYWGCNNAKDLNVRLEYAPDPRGRPEHLGFVPSPRDIKWQELYHKFKGKIDEQFAFLAFRTAPLVSASAFDAKFASSEMAARLMCWAVFGKPNQREWVPSRWEQENYPHIAGIYSSGYRLFGAQASEALRRIVAEREKERLGKANSAAKPAAKANYKDRLWKGWILPASDADLWLTTGTSLYHQVLSADDVEKELEAHRAALRLAQRQGDRPLRQIRSTTASWHWYDIAASKGVLLLDALRRELGDDKFLKMMGEFLEANTTKTASEAQFVAAAEKAAGKPMVEFFSRWLEGTGPSDPGAVYLTGNLRRRFATALIVYGTTTEAGANRHAAELMQRRFLDSYESQVPIRKDFEASDEELAGHDVVLVGRPETNSALAALAARIGLRYEGAVFRIDDRDHGSENEALLLAAENPLNPARMVLVAAGNSALETVRVASAGLDRWEYAVVDAGKQTEFGFRKR